MTLLFALRVAICYKYFYLVFLENFKFMIKCCTEKCLCALGRPWLVHTDIARTKLLLHKPASKFLSNAHRHFTCKSAFELSRGHLCLGGCDTLPGFLHCQCPQMLCACVGNLQAFERHFLFKCLSSIFHVRCVRLHSKIRLMHFFILNPIVYL